MPNPTIPPLSDAARVELALRKRRAWGASVNRLSAELSLRSEVVQQHVDRLVIDGKAALLVADDSLEGTMVSLVIVDASGRVVCKEATTVGGEK